MKKELLILALAGTAAAHADFIAGWDFSGAAGVGAFGDSYASDVAGTESTGATIQVNDAAGNPIIRDIGNSVGVANFRADNGFNNLGTQDYSTVTPTGQQSLQFSGYTGGSFSFTVDFGGTVDNALVDFDWVMDDASLFNGANNDFLSVQYSVGGVLTDYQPALGGVLTGTLAPDGYYVPKGTTWTSSEADNGFGGFLNGQNTASINLNGITGVEAVIFTVTADSAAATMAFDNIAVQGTNFAVPEPSTYAAIFGAIALAFAASRRRK